MAFACLFTLEKYEIFIIILAGTLLQLVSGGRKSFQAKTWDGNLW